MIGYKIKRPECGNSWFFAGVTPFEVAYAIQNEIESNEGLTADDCDQIVIEAFETTQEEINSLPEFQGW